jgi:hypothetical protein
LVVGVDTGQLTSRWFDDGSHLESNGESSPPPATHHDERADQTMTWSESTDSEPTS